MWTSSSSEKRRPWNKGKLVGQKPPLKLPEIWAIRTRLELSGRLRDLALFNLAIDSKLRGCDLVRLRVRDVANGDRILHRTLIIRRKTQRPVQFEISPPTRETLILWLAHSGRCSADYLFPSRLSGAEHLSTRQYARLLGQWVAEVGLDPALYGTHSLRRTKPTLIYRRSRNLRAVQLLLGHSKIESTVRYLGVEIEDALALAEELPQLGQGLFGSPWPAADDEVISVGHDSTPQTLLQPPLLPPQHEPAHVEIRQQWREGRALRNAAPSILGFARPPLPPPFVAEPGPSLTGVRLPIP